MADKIEEIGYNIVGEKLKTADNVIDYNIREEQTKDTFAIDNANNQTTTGMATQIPGVNTPKLLASTSIIGGSGGGGGGGFKYSEIEVSVTATIPGGTESVFNSITSSSLSDDLYLDGYKIYTTDGGLYMFQVGCATGNVSRTITDAGFIYVLGTATLLTEFRGGANGDWEFSSGFAQVPAGAYFRLGITPSGNCRPDGKIRLLKLQ